MKLCYTFALALLLVLLRCVKESTLMTVKFTSVKCEEYDKSFATFKKCFLKAVARDTVSLYLHVQLHQLPVQNVTLNAASYQWGNGYRPFMYNNTLDFCQFMKNPNRYMFWKIIVMNIIKTQSNINHSCPYNHDIIVNGLILKGDMFNLIPFPTNEYMVQFNVGAYNRLRAIVRVYVRITE